MIGVNHASPRALLRKFGWLMKDEAVKAYSANFKPGK